MPASIVVVGRVEGSVVVAGLVDSVVEPGVVV